MKRLHRRFQNRVPGAYKPLALGSRFPHAIKRPHALALLWLAILLLAALPARAQQQQAINVTARAGYGGAYRSGEWFPITIDISNDGPDVRGELEWLFPGQRNEPNFRQVIDLPRGSRKRVSMSAFSRGFARSGQVRLLVNDIAISDQVLSLEPLDADRFIIGVISSDPTLLNSLDSFPVGGTTNTLVRHMQPNDLPEQGAALRGLNVLFLHDIDSSALSQGQRSALSLWTQLGGQLVVSGGVGGQRAAAGIADLLPVDVGAGVNDGDIRPLLAAYSNTPLPSQATSAPLSEIQVRAGATNLISDSELLLRWNYGVGTVTYSAFDIALLRGWPDEPEVWGGVLDRITLFVPGLGSRTNQTSLLQSILQIPALGLPSTGTIMLFLLGYIVVIGPINYLILRRMQRLEWAWFSIPVVVLFFAGGLYLVGFGLRGSQSQLNQVTIVQATEGQSRGMATAFIGLFSPRRTNYTLGFPADALLHETRSWDDLSGRTTPVFNSETSVEMRDVLVDVGSVRMLVSESPVDLPINIQTQLQNNGNIISGQVRNNGPETLNHVLIVQGTNFQELGSLAPGASQIINLANGSRTFPWGINLPEEGIFNRKLLVNTLFNGQFTLFGSMTSGSSIDDNGVYMLAWREQPSIPVRIDGQEQAQNGQTLYVIRLKT